MHPRISLSAISTFTWSLEEDLAFYADAGITNVGVSVAKLERAGWDAGTRRVADAGLRVTNLIGLGPFRLDDPGGWDGAARAPAAGPRCGRGASGPSARCSRPGPPAGSPGRTPPTRSSAPSQPVLAEAAARQIPFALEHTNSLRVDVGFVHSLRDVIDLARRLGTGVCMEINACWAERGLDETIAGGVDTIQLVQVSDYAVGTLSTPNRLVPGDGDIPIARILDRLLQEGTRGASTSSWSGPGSTRRATRPPPAAPSTGSNRRWPISTPSPRWARDSRGDRRLRRLRGRPAPARFARSRPAGGGVPPQERVRVDRAVRAHRRGVRGGRSASSSSPTSRSRTRSTRTSGPSSTSTTTASSSC